MPKRLWDSFWSGIHHLCAFPLIISAFMALTIPMNQYAATAHFCSSLPSMRTPM